MPRTREWGPIRRFPNEWPPLNPEPLDPTEYPFIPDQSISAANLVGEIPPEKLQLRGIKVYRSTAQSLSDTVEADITFDTTSFNVGFTDPGASFTTITIPVDGVYDLVGQLEIAFSGANVDGTLWLYVNGGKHEAASARNNAQRLRLNVKAVKSMSAGDTVGLHCVQASGASRNTATGEIDIALTAMFRGTV